MSSDEHEFAQGDLVWAQYPLTDKVDKLKRRPVLVISNSQSNRLDNDYIVIPITKTIRQQPFSLVIEPHEVSGTMPVQSELRCNKLFTVRKTLISDRIGILMEQKLKQAINLAVEAIYHESTFELANT